MLTQGTGGVSCFGIQLASALGATVIATSSSDEKLASAKRLSATHTIKYRQHPVWSKRVVELTAGKDVDLVLEVGGSASIEQRLKATRFGGVIMLTGILTQAVLTDLVPEIMIWVEVNPGAGSKDMFMRLLRTMEDHEIHPLLASEHDFELTNEAVEAMKSQKAVGKIVVKC